MKRQTLKTAFVTVTALIGAARGVCPARAQEPELVPKPARRQRLYVAQYTGITSIGRSDLRLVQPRLGTDITYRGVGYDGRPREGSPNYGVKIGHFLPRSPRLGFEIEYNHTKMYARVGESRPLTGTWQGQAVDGTERLSDRVQRYQISNGVNSVSLSVLYRVPVAADDRYPDGRLQPYIGGGPQYSYLYSINTVGGERVREKYHTNGWGYRVLGGVRFLATPRLGVFAEGKYQHGNATSLIADRGDSTGGRGYTDIRIQHLVGGVFYQF